MTYRSRQGGFQSQLSSKILSEKFKIQQFVGIRNEASFACAIFKTQKKKDLHMKEYHKEV
jgi:hypothetical protein